MFFDCCDFLFVLLFAVVRTLRAAGFASEASGVKTTKKFDREGWRCISERRARYCKKAREDSNQIAFKGVILASPAKLFSTKRAFLNLSVFEEQR